MTGRVHENLISPRCNNCPAEPGIALFDLVRKRRTCFILRALRRAPTSIPAVTVERRPYAGLHRGSAVGPPATSNASFRALVAHREFRAMWLAIGQSQFGDQLGRVALSILVFN